MAVRSVLAFYNVEHDLHFLYGLFVEPGISICSYVRIDLTNVDRRGDVMKKELTINLI